MRPLFIFLTAFLIFSCKKKDPLSYASGELFESSEVKPGLPANAKQISGFLYASSILENYAFSTMMGEGWPQYAAFSNTPNDLMAGHNHLSVFGQTNNSKHWGNISVGELKFNSIPLIPNFQEPSVDYFGRGKPMPFNYPAVWEGEGNKTFKPFMTDLNKYNPVIDTSKVIKSMSRSQDLVIDVSEIAFNYDTLSVEIRYNDLRPYARKTILYPEKIIRFSKAELTQIPATDQSIIIYYHLFIYAHQVLNNKTFVYELSRKYQIAIRVTQ